MKNAKPILKSLFRIVRLIVVVIVLLVFVCWVYLAQPTTRSNSESSVEVSPAKLRTHVEKLAVEFHPRSCWQFENLNATADYISEHFKKAGAKTYSQGFTVSLDSYQNVVGTFNEGASKTIIIGAHYDSHSGTPGADDNASGVAGLIELGYLLGKQKLDCEIQLVGYTLEEPPFFGTEMMGSYQHAVKVAKEGKDIRGVIVLEMIGYFSEERASQSYPVVIMNFMYPTKGNYIAAVSNTDNRGFTKDMKGYMKGTTSLPVYSLNAPSAVPGVDFSDHRNYWPFDIPAVMITDTSFYRNERYHTPEDTVDTLNYEKMAEVVVATYEAVLKFAE